MNYSNSTPSASIDAGPMEVDVTPSAVSPISTSKFPKVSDIINLRRVPTDDTIDDGLRASVLMNVFQMVWDNPAWKSVLNGDFVSLARCREVVQAGGHLVTLLDRCIEQGEYQPLFNDAALRQNKSPHGFPLSLALIAAFQSDYIGTHHEIMLKAIDEVMTLNESQSYYARILPVVQSSGTGKSKTMYRIAMDRIVIQMCLREADPPGTIAYPYSDEVIREQVTKAPSAQDQDASKNFWRGFLVSLFKALLLQLEEFTKWNTQDRAQGEQRFVEYRHLVQECFELFNDRSRRRQFYTSVISSMRPIGVTDTLTLTYQRLDDFVKNACSDFPGYPIILSLDEIHVLYEPQLTTPHTSYSRLKSVLAELSRKNLCVVALTTATLISKIAPSKSSAPSFRERELDLAVPVPFTELLFDTFLGTAPLNPGEVTAETAGTLAFIVKFGRPLWYSLYAFRTAAEQPDPSAAISRMMQVVQEKLSGRPLPLQGPFRLDASSIAILSARLLLDLSPATSVARDYEQELVRSHLRTVYSVHEDREVIMTGSSSEPIVAEGAAQIMNMKEPHMDMWDILLQFVSTGLAAQGAVGELIGRAISIFAMDKAINNLPEKAQSELKYHSHIPVNTYYKTLLTDDAWRALRNSFPVNRAELTSEAAAKNFETAFEDAYFHFSHYAKVHDASPLNKTYLWALWLRGTAVLCQDRQELTDRVLPIFFSRFATLSADSVSCVLEQDKTSIRANPDSVPTQSAEQLGIFNGAKDLPYIAVVHCYSLLENQGVRTTQEANYNLRRPSTNQQSPRYQLDIRGLEPYGVLDDAVKTRIRAMINGSKSFLIDKHPRRYGLGALLQLKPFFAGYKDSITWFTGLLETLVVHHGSYIPEH